ncbi:MAG TPA: cytochrome c oxidase subunit 3 [Pyrinomonadaceae bacterium]|jgi:cytochrome c oxidase subunit 3|nr:cytochrome c oxidase subunit 3 [Pyrinomonadaceae bacterium]
MGTTVITEKTVTRPKGVAKGGRFNGAGRRGTGGRGPGGGGGGGDDGSRHLTPDHRYRIGMWVALASIMMLFTALTSAYIVRSRLGTASDWQPIPIPRMIWLSTSLIILSSATFEAARKFIRRGDDVAYRNWLMATAGLGLAFLATQLLAWRELVAQGIYLASNPHSSFFYLLTGVHGLHLLGGILMLALLLARAWRSRRRDERRSQRARRRDSADAVALYWHFMDGLWIYLFLLLFLWR